MRAAINPAMQHIRHFVEQLPKLFPVSGEMLHDGRNQIRAFDIGDERYVVKRYKRPSVFNTLIYSFFRKSKARRAYEYALRLRELGIDTPEPAAWSEYRHRGLINDTYFISRWSDYASLSDVMEDFPAPYTLPIIEGFTRFTVLLHEKGIGHKDFNQTNTLWQQDANTGEYKFQLIDINRMKFLPRPLNSDQCMINLRRLSCPALAFLYVLDCYAEARKWDLDDTVLHGLFFRLAFGRRQQFKKRFRERKIAATAKKQR